MKLSNFKLLLTIIEICEFVVRAIPRRLRLR